MTCCWVGAMRPSRVVRSAGACLATRPGCSPRTLAPATTALLFLSCERRTLRGSLGRDFVNRSLQHDAAREHAYELSILSGCAAPLSECGGRARGMSPPRFARRLAPAEEPCRLSTSLARVSRCASPPYGSVSSGPWRAQKRRDEGAALVAETSSTGRDSRVKDTRAVVDGSARATDGRSCVPLLDGGLEHPLSPRLTAPEGGALENQVPDATKTTVPPSPREGRRPLDDQGAWVVR